MPIRERELVIATRLWKVGKLPLWYEMACVEVDFQRYMKNSIGD